MTDEEHSTNYDNLMIYGSITLIGYDNPLDKNMFNSEIVKTIIIVF